MERIPGIPGFHMPMPAHELDTTPPEPIVARRRARAKQVSEAPPPSMGTLVPAPWDDTTETRMAAVKAGYRVAPPPPQGGSIAPYYEQTWWKSGKGFAMVLGGFATLFGALGGIAIPLINAMKQPDAANEKIHKLEEAEEQRKLAAPLQKDAEEAREKEREKQLNELRARIQELDLRYPAPKVDPHRRPKD